MFNTTALLSTLITSNHILHYHNVLDAMGHVSVRNPNTNTTFFIALQLGTYASLQTLAKHLIYTNTYTSEGPAVVSSPTDIGEYYISNGSALPGTKGGYAERYIHSEILRAYPDVNAVVHSHAEDVLPYTILPSTALQPVRPRNSQTDLFTKSNLIRYTTWPVSSAPKFQTSISKTSTRRLIRGTC
jgi:ribulose-5-phosphate 4-epimerase/fuculose-1-phosphate aldolase